MSQAALEIGLCGEYEQTVQPCDTAAALGSGGLDVFSTPSLVTLMERCAVVCLAPYLPEGQSTVGIRLDVKHLAATPVGMRVRCRVVLTEIDRRRLVFACQAFDDKGLIGEGTQERFIVDNGRFMEKARAKLEEQP